MATTLSGQVSALATQIGADVKKVVSNVGNLSELTTTQKASLVVALNELKSGLTDLESQLGAQINDQTTGTDTTWSSTKISSAISEAISALINGAPDALDTLQELAAAIEKNQDAIAALQSIAAGHVKYDAAQSLTTEQKAQARSNIDAPSTSDVTSVSNMIGSLASLDTTDQSSVVAAINEVLVTAAKGVSDAASAAAAAAAAQQTANTAQQTATNAQNAVTALSEAVGDTTTDFVAIYTAARGTV